MSGWKGRDKWDHAVPSTQEEVICLLRRRIEVHTLWRDWFLSGYPDEVAEASKRGVGTAESQQVYIDQYEAAIQLILSSAPESSES